MRKALHNVASFTTSHTHSHTVGESCFANCQLSNTFTHSYAHDTASEEITFMYDHAFSPLLLCFTVCVSRSRAEQSSAAERQVKWRSELTTTCHVSRTAIIAQTDRHRPQRSEIQAKTPAFPFKQPIWNLATISSKVETVSIMFQLHHRQAKEDSFDRKKKKRSFYSLLKSIKLIQIVEYYNQWSISQSSLHEFLSLLNEPSNQLSLIKWWAFTL